MKQFTFLFLFIFASNIIIGQEVGWQEHPPRQFPRGIVGTGTFDSSIKGSQYIDKSYQKVTFLNNQNMVFSGRYNAYSDLIEIIGKTGKKYFTPNKEHPYAVKFSGTNKIYKAFLITNKKSVFFRILMTNEKITLLAREKISFSEEFLPQTGYDRHRPPTFKREKDQYYIYLNNEKKVVSLSIKKDAFLKLFSTNSKTIKKYILKEKLNIKKEKDLIKIFKFHSSL